MWKQRVDDDDRLFRVTLNEGVPFAVVTLKLSADEVWIVGGKDGPFFVGKEGRCRVFKTDHDGPAG